MTQNLAALSDELRRYIGKTVVFRTGTIQARDFQRFAVSCGDINPVYFDKETATLAGYEQPVAPLLFLSSMFGWGSGPVEEELRRDGAGESEVSGLPLDGLRIMGGGQELEFYDPVTDGSEVTVETCIEDIELKEGASGALLVIRISRVYTAAEGNVLLRCTETLIGR